jgi:hypothetical protein
MTKCAAHTTVHIVCMHAPHTLPLPHTLLLISCAALRTHTMRALLHTDLCVYLVVTTGKQLFVSARSNSHTYTPALCNVQFVAVTVNACCMPICVYCCVLPLLAASVQTQPYCTVALEARAECNLSFSAYRK